MPPLTSTGGSPATATSVIQGTNAAWGETRPPLKKSGVSGLLVAGAVLVPLIGAGAWWVLRPHSDASPSPDSSVTAVSGAQPGPSAPVQPPVPPPALEPPAVTPPPAPPPSEVLAPAPVDKPVTSHAPAAARKGATPASAKPSTRPAVAAPRAGRGRAGTGRGSTAARAGSDTQTCCGRSQEAQHGGTTLMRLPLRRSRVMWLGSMVVGSVSFAAGPAAAQDPAARAQAVQLFDAADKLMHDGQISAACPKYAASMKLDPQLGALLHLADCYAKNGQVASAWGSFREAEEMARMKNDDRASYAKEQAAQLEPRLSHLTVLVPDSANLQGLEVRVDGSPISSGAWSLPSPVDRGPHNVEARAPGHQPWSSTVKVTGDGHSSRDPDAQRIDGSRSRCRCWHYAASRRWRARGSAARRQRLADSHARLGRHRCGRREHRPWRGVLGPEGQQARPTQQCLPDAPQLQRRPKTAS